MAVTIKDLRFSIYLNNADAKKAAIETQKLLQAVGDEMKQLAAEGKKDTPMYREKKKAFDDLTASMEQQKKEAGLLGMSMKELRKLAITMKNDMSRMIPDSAEWKKLDADIKVVEARITELKGTAKTTESSLSKLANGFNKYLAMGTTFIATVTGMSFAFKKMAEDVAKMDDVYSDVRKTTNLTKEQVLDLNESFKKMDTRTSRESLNNLARDAGKLGIEGKQNILDFVDAGNQINVALGEDLGDDAIKNIGKMVGVFRKSTKELQNIGLKEQMLSVASAVNDLGAASSADESFLVEFAGRMGGVASQAKISMSAILGFGSALDQNMQNVEMSASSLSNFIAKLMAEPAKFAKLAGMDVKQFTDLLNTDANQAIKNMLSALNEKGGFQALIPVFKDMGLDGVRAIQVLSTLAGNVKQVDDAQKLANKSMIAGTSVTKEYGIKNDNLAAKLDKAKKGFMEAALQLGERLNPVLLKSTNLVTYLTRALIVLPKWLNENKGEILILVVALGAYAIASSRVWLATKEQIIVEKLKIFWTTASTAATYLHVAAVGYLTGATRAANLAMKQFFITLGLNPFTALIAIVGLATFGFYKLVTSQTAAEKAYKEYNNQVNIEITKSDQLFNALKKTAAGSEERRLLIEKINGLYGSYLGYQLNEKMNLDEINKAQLKVNSSLRDKIGLQIKESSKSGIIEKYVPKQVKIADQMTNTIAATEGDAVAEIITKKIQDILATGSYTDKAILTAQKYLKDKLGKNFTAGMDFLPVELAKSIREMNVDLSDVDKKFDRIISKNAKPSEAGGGGGGNTGPQVGDKQFLNGKWCTWDGSKWVVDKLTTGGGDGDDATKKAVAKLDNDLMEAQIKRKKAHETDKVSEESYQADMLQIQVDYLNKKQKLFKSGTKEYNEIENQLVDISLAKTKTANETALKSFTDLHQAKLEAITSTDALERIRIENESKNQDEHDDALLALDQTTAQARYDVAVNYNNEVKDYVFASEEEKKKITDDANKELIDADKALNAAKKAILRKKIAAERAFEEETKRLREKYRLDEENGIAKQYKKELAYLRAHIKDKKELEKAEFQLRLKTAGEYAENVLQIANAASDVSKNIQEAETLAIDNKYAAQLNAAKKAGHDTTALEDKIENEKKAVKKKYADLDFAITVAQIIASTALGIQKALEIPPPFGGILAGIIGASGIAQMAVANQQRIAVKNLWTGGFTDNVGERTPAGVVHGGEFVANAKAVKNPSVRKFLDVFNAAQMNGSIQMLNTTQILERVRSTGYSGGNSGMYSENKNGAVGTFDNSIAMAIVAENSKQMERLNAHFDKGIKSYSVITGNYGSVKQLERYENMRANITRGN